MAKKVHPGFKAVQEKIAQKEGVSKERAGAMLASASRHASKKAKKENPRLKRVSGGDGMMNPTMMDKRERAKMVLKHGGY